jgi:hypothetical protein
MERTNDTMPILLNKSQRPYHFGGTLLWPGDSGDIPSSFTEKPIVQDWIDMGELEAVAAEEPTP